MRRLHPRRFRTAVLWTAVVTGAGTIVTYSLNLKEAAFLLYGLWLGFAVFSEYLEWLLRNAAIELKETRR
ncbi:hypothetical protein DRO42_02895 [Candidatus Bathyarchaeota archaeon]|nr:MAG: hypothetical protein DRO42_02895 [Candidatus Bathyarchaeota archaeon]